MKTEAAFEYAANLGYDGVELMVWGESISQDIDAVAKLSRRYRMPVLSVHAPCLLISQRVWGANPIPKLDRSVRAAEKLGAQTVVVHPPFRWQRRYVEGFSEQVAHLEASSDVLVAVENMFPFRADRFFGPGQTMERMRRRGGGPGPRISAFAPSYDPLDGDHAHYTLDLSHTATAGTDALDMAQRMGSGLVHLHLCDGSGLPADEHLAPGQRYPTGGRGVRDAGRRRLRRPCRVRGVHVGSAFSPRARGHVGRVIAVRPHAPVALTFEGNRQVDRVIHHRDGAPRSRC